MVTATLVIQTPKKMLKYFLLKKYWSFEGRGSSRNS
jgi:hypothetical protein